MLPTRQSGLSTDTELELKFRHESGLLRATA